MTKKANSAGPASHEARSVLIWLFSFLCAALLLAVVPSMRGADEQKAAGKKSDKPFTLSVDVRRVVLTVTVESKKDGFIGELTADNFAVFDQGEPQEIVDFVGTDQPVTVGVIVDNSRSMTPRRVAVLNAATGFVMRSNPEDDFFVVHFNDFVRLGLPGSTQFSTDPRVVRSGLWSLEPDGRTALYDAVRLGLQHARGGKWEKRALLVISDGGDNASQTELDSILDLARGETTLIYSLGVYDEDNPDRAPGVLKKLASATGGEALFPESSIEISEACARIAEELRRQYTIVYSPEGEGDKHGFHKVDVRLKGVDARGAKVRVREGYYEDPVELPEGVVADAR